MENGNTRMTPANTVAMFLVVGVVAAGFGLILGPSFEVIGAAPTWTRGVFLACTVANVLLFALDKLRSLSDLKALGFSLLFLVLLMTFSGAGRENAEGLDAALDDMTRWLVVYGGLVLAPIAALMEHGGGVYTRVVGTKAEPGSPLSDVSSGD